MTPTNKSHQRPADRHPHSRSITTSPRQTVSVRRRYSYTLCCRSRRASRGVPSNSPSTASGSCLRLTTRAWRGMQTVGAATVHCSPFISANRGRTGVLSLHGRRRDHYFKRQVELFTGSAAGKAVVELLQCQVQQVLDSAPGDELPDLVHAYEVVVSGVFSPGAVLAAAAEAAAGGHEYKDSRIASPLDAILDSFSKRKHSDQWLLWPEDVLKAWSCDFVDGVCDSGGGDAADGGSGESTGDGSNNNLNLL